MADLMPDRGPWWRRHAAALVALALLTVAVTILHREALLGGAVYHMDDAADGYYPGHIAVARAFADGELPTWERNSWSGWPLVVDPYNGVFYPPNVVYYLVGAARGLGYAIAFHVLLGGFGVWLLLRRRGLSVELALFGGLAFALSSFGVVRIRHVIFVQMMGWLPWILVGVEGWLRDRRRRELVLVALATGLALVAGALSIGHFAALVIAGYTVGRCLQGELRRALRDLLLLGLAAGVGALIAAVQLAPTLAHLPHSPRSLGSDYSFTSSYAWPSLRYFFTLLAPDLFGGEVRARYVGAPNHWELAGWYTGALALALAPAALLRRRGGGVRQGAELWLLAGLVALAVALALGDAGPVHKLFFDHLPLYAAIRCPARALLMAVLAVPILGSHGLDSLLSRARLRRRLWPGWIAVAALLTVGAALWLYHHRAGRGAVLAEELWHGAWKQATWVLTVGGALLLAALVAGLRPRLAAGGMALVLGLDLLVVGRGYVQPMPADYPAGMERFAAVEWLLAHRSGDRFVNDPQGPFRLHNVGMVVDLENASGYDSVGIWRYVNFLYLLQNGRPYPELKLKHDFAGIGVHNLSSRLLDLMNVRWLIAAQPPDARWVERFRAPSPSTAPAAKYEPHWDPQLKVYENLRVLPRAFVAYRATVPGDDERLARRLIDPAFDPATEVLLERPPRFPVDGPPRAPTAAKLVEARRHRLVFEVEAAARGLLFVGDAHYPGWSATVDGRPEEILRANWAFRGLPLEPGRHRVEMTYRSRPVAIGGALSLLGLLALAPLGGLLPGRRRRS